MAYYKTTDVTIQQQLNFEQAAKGQDKLVEQVFYLGIGKLTAEQVYNILVAGGKIDKDLVPLTSIRRACSTLKKKGKLIRTSETAKGKFKHPIHYYQLAAA